MKPPWKFLAQLVSRRRASDTPDQATEDDGDPKLDSQRASEPLPASPKTKAVPKQEDESSSSAPVEPATAPGEIDTASLTTEAGAEKARAEKAGVVEEQQPPLADVPVPASKAGDPPRISREKPSRAAARKGRVHPTAPGPAAAGAEPAQAPSVSANPLFDEAASLDEDIRQLRDQLAQKLRLQNSQLRKMLERFERS